MDAMSDKLVRESRPTMSDVFRSKLPSGVCNEVKNVDYQVLRSVKDDECVQYRLMHTIDIDLVGMLLRGISLRWSWREFYMASFVLQ
jgi:hypothetical protein